MPARLHHERIASARVPTQWMILTHGMYGTGGNWRGIARKVHARRPDWGIVLVDLRLHGRSEAGTPPHTVAACADDLTALIAELGDVRAVAGHSFGGKVAMATRAATPLAQTWILDSTPSARPGEIADPANTVVGVLEMMRRLPKQWDQRDSFAAAIMAQGHGPALAQWLAMNLVPAAGAYELRLDLDALHALLVDYYAIDLWSAIEAPRGDVEMVVAERSTTVSADDRARLASAPPHVHTHYVAADHWLHMEAPDAVVELFATRLPGTPDPAA